MAAIHYFPAKFQIYHQKQRDTFLSEILKICLHSVPLSTIKKSSVLRQNQSNYFPQYVYIVLCRVSE